MHGRPWHQELDKVEALGRIIARICIIANPPETAASPVLSRPNFER
jgi:hypothetical protein